MIVPMCESLWIDELGVDVYERQLSGIYGLYIHSYRIIVIDPRLAPVQYRSTLMHELGHAYYGHDDSCPRWERDASLWAASQMIPYCQFWKATQIHASPVAVAHELGVLPRDVINYQDLLDRSLSYLLK